MSAQARTYRLRNNKLECVDRCLAEGNQADLLRGIMERNSRAAHPPILMYDLQNGDTVFITDVDGSVAATYDVAMPPQKLQVTRR